MELRTAQSVGRMGPTYIFMTIQSLGTNLVDAYNPLADLDYAGCDGMSDLFGT